MRQAELFEENPTTARNENSNPLVVAYGLDALGRKCRDCVHLTFRDRVARYYKCELRFISSGAATDHRAGWDACAQFIQRLAPVARRNELRGVGPAGAHHEHGGGSHAAAVAIERHGAKAQRKRALGLVRERPGFTTNELSGTREPDNPGRELALRILLQRRLPELRDCRIPLVYSVPAKGIRRRGRFRWYPVAIDAGSV